VATRLGAGARIQEQQLPVLLKGSRYAERLPIGKPETIKAFQHDRLRQFYRDWYRPDLMTVVAVGTSIRGGPPADRAALRAPETPRRAPRPDGL